MSHGHEIHIKICTKFIHQEIHNPVNEFLGVSSGNQLANWQDLAVAIG